MNTQDNKISNNALAVMALASEYCRAMEMAGTTEPRDFIDKMIHLLPRIYMSVTDIPPVSFEEPDYVFGASHLDESYYNKICRDIAAILGEHDTYLETFHQDMKYSETPIAATISECLADIFQVLYNFVEDIRNADFEIINEHIGSLRADFSEYWSQILCNVMRPLNEIYNRPDDDDDINDEMAFD